MNWDDSVVIRPAEVCRPVRLHLNQKFVLQTDTFHEIRIPPGRTAWSHTRRRKRPETIKSIVEHTGLDRHQVASLLKNEAKHIPLEALSRICDYLIDHGYATADQLPVHRLRSTRISGSCWRVVVR